MPDGVRNIDGIRPRRQRGFRSVSPQINSPTGALNRPRNFGMNNSVRINNPVGAQVNNPTEAGGVNEKAEENVQVGPVQEYPNQDIPRKKSHKGVIIALIVLLVVFGGVASLFGFGVISFEMFKGSGGESKPVVEPKEPKKPISGEFGNDLDFSFLKMENEEKNVIYSPLSIKYALNLLDEGASGETKTQIEEVLGNTELTGYQNVEDKLSLANSVFIKNDFKEFVLPNYIDTVTEKYDAEILFSDFADASEIDSWIDRKTFGLIKNSGVKIGSDTVMALVNALAIQLDWKLKFEAESTSGRDFNYVDGTKDEVTMMTRSFTGDGARLYDADGVKAVAMDLEEVAGTGLEFVAIMPEEDLDGYVEELDEKALDTVLDGLVAVDEYSSAPKDAQTVKPIEKLDYLIVDIPKFKFDYELEEFGKKLENFGIKDAFNAEKADFSGISEEEKLYVSQAIHKANIDFSEDGIKAAAITIFVMDVNTAIAEPDDDQPVVKTITFDKPFMFVIRDKNTGEKWFVGTVYEPNKWADDESEYQG